MSGGTLGGAADIEVETGAEFTWTGGTISSVEASPGTLTVDAGATLTIAPSISVLLSGARFCATTGRRPGRPGT